MIGLSMIDAMMVTLFSMTMIDTVPSLWVGGGCTHGIQGLPQEGRKEGLWRPLDGIVINLDW